MDAVVAIRDAHAPGCGSPPGIVNGEDRHVSYFENAHGEQWVFTFDRLTGQGMLYGGDVGWEHPTIIDGQIGDLALSHSERIWLAACLLAATGAELPPGPPVPNP